MFDGHALSEVRWLLATGFQEPTASWRQQVGRLAKSLFTFFLPPACACCRRSGPIFCAECKSAVRWLEQPLCRRCGQPQVQLQSRCIACWYEPLPLEQLRAATLYADPVKRVIQRMKYEGLFALAQPLAELMADAWPKWSFSFDLAVPIPLHPDRLRQRGFNQSELLLEGLASRFNWSMEPAAIRRNRSTRPQVELNARERWENVHGAFIADPGHVARRRILLVDDVSTSGATLAAAAEALFNAGATTVSAYCVSLATGRFRQSQSDS